MSFVEGTKAFKGEKAYTRKEALQHFRDAATMTHKPFIYLSAGVSNPVFIETLELAVESGTSFNGVLCGRATWKTGIAIYAKQGAKAFEDLAQHHRRRKHQQRQPSPERAPTPWHEKVSGPLTPTGTTTTGWPIFNPGGPSFAVSPQRVGCLPLPTSTPDRGNYKIKRRCIHAASFSCS